MKVKDLKQLLSDKPAELNDEQWDEVDVLMGVNPRDIEIFHVACAESSGWGAFETTEGETAHVFLMLTNDYEMNEEQAKRLGLAQEG